MRMWMIDPGLLCRQHLLGEHYELHKLVGTLRRRRSVRGYVEGGLVELGRIRSRHGELVREMGRRGMRHQSPLGAFGRPRGGRVDRRRSVHDLVRRCRRCRDRIRAPGVG